MILAVTSRTQDRSSLMHLIEEIKLMFNISRSISFVKVDRSPNRVRHSLAKFARAESQTMMWLGSGPDCVLQALELDLNVTLDA